MTDDTILSPCPRALDPRDAEALAEIERMCAKGLAEIDRLTAALNEVIDERVEFLAEIARLRFRITGLEAALAATHGTLAAPTPDDDQPATYTHDVPPNAPR